jgi:Domain of unknown function (DUF1707)
MAMRYYAPFPAGGGSAWTRGPHAQRIGDAERDAAAADLGEHFSAGRLTLDELHERLDEVFSAKTFGQLTRIMADLPIAGRPLWRSGPGGLSPAGARPVPGPHAGWRPAGLPYDGPLPYGPLPYDHLGMPGGSWHTVNSAADFHSREPEPEPTSADRAGRFAALSLLLLAMLIWLFTALLFARHGFSPQVAPSTPFSHTLQYEQSAPVNAQTGTP